MRTGLLSDWLLVCSTVLVLSAISDGTAGEIPTPLVLAKPSAPADTKRSQSSENPWLSLVDSFRLTSAIQVHHFTAPHAKDLWREVDDQRTVNLKTTATLIPGKLLGESELSYREPAAGLQAGLGRAQDQMVRMVLTGTFNTVRYGFSYRSAGKDYGKEADQATRELWGEWRAGPATVKATTRETSNNVAGNPTLTQLRQRQEQLSLAVAQSVWPGFNLSYAHAGTASTFDPEGVSAVRMESNTFAASLSYQTPVWTTKLGATYAHVSTQSPAISESDQLLYSFNGTYRPLATLGLDPAITLREDIAKTTGVKTETPTAALSLKYAPAPTLTWTGSGSYGLSRSTDGLTNSRAFSAKQAFSYKPLLASKLATAFSLETGFQRTTDRANADRATSDLSAFFRLQIAGF